MDIIKQKKSAYVEVVEQPAGKGLRFRYECEGRSAGSIPGASSTLDNRTFPTIKVHGYEGRAVVVVSCVTAESPYRPHPHNLVGKEGCKKGVCTLELGPDMTCSFPSLGIQCVKKKDIEESLGLRQQIRVDPFQTGFSHKTNSQNIDLNCVRLAFQVFLEGNDKGAFTFALKPVVSDPIYDKKSKCDLTICRLTETSGPVAGGKEILLFCEKINKDDVQIRFYEETDNQLIWEAFGDFQPSDVHKQYGICFRTPKYRNIEIDQPVKVHLQLRRPSDGAVSESREFEFLPLDAGRAYWSAKRLKTNFSVFNQILSAEQASRSQCIGFGTEELLKRKIPVSSGPENNQLTDEMLQSLQHQSNPKLLVTDLTSQPSQVSGMGAINQSRMSGVIDVASSTGDEQVQIKTETESIPTDVLCSSSSSNPVNCSSSSNPVNYRPLKPVAMPGSNQINRSSFGMMQINNVIPPEVPVRSPHKSSLLQSNLGGSPVHGIHQQMTHPPLQPPSTAPQHGIQQQVQHPPHQPPAPAPQARPLSDLSLLSESTQCDTGSTYTRQSVNEILSLAETNSQFDLDSISINTFIQPLGTMDQLVSGDAKGERKQSVGSGSTNVTTSAVGQTEYMGSMTSVATVRECRSSQINPGVVSQQQQHPINNCNSQIMATSSSTPDGVISGVPIDSTAPTNTPMMDLDKMELEDIGQIYDDVMMGGCVYDDVDIKYDDIMMEPPSGRSGEEEEDPPVPPIRKRGLSVDRTVEKPLPVTPKNPSIITKLTEKKNELLKEREKEAEKKRLAEAEKERKKTEEKERKRAEDEARKAAKKREEEEKKLTLEKGASLQNLKDNSGEQCATGVSGEVKQSLFQRLFNRNQQQISTTASQQSSSGSLVTPPIIDGSCLETAPGTIDDSNSPCLITDRRGSCVEPATSIDNNVDTAPPPVPMHAGASNTPNLTQDKLPTGSNPVLTINNNNNQACNNNNMEAESNLDRLRDYPTTCSPPVQLSPGFDTDLADIEQIITSTTAQLQRLDSVVTEFTQQFPTPAQQHTTAAQ